MYEKPIKRKSEGGKQMKSINKESIIKDLEAVIMVSENKAAKAMLQNTIKFINKQ